MATIAFFHAHPDDEAIGTSGSMRRASAAGHRVVLVVATRGEEGEVADGFLDDGESLEARRTSETEAAARILGVGRVAFLGYRDSGMMGEPANDHPDSFWKAPIGEAAQRLAAILVEEAADVLTVYDSDGGYGHPDHIQVHRVGHAAAAIAGTSRVYEETVNRDRLREVVTSAIDAGIDLIDDDLNEDVDFGIPDSEITTEVDVAEFLADKRAAMAAHASQIDESSFFLAVPEEIFAATFGIESFVRIRPPFEGSIPADRETWLIPE